LNLPAGFTCPAAKECMAKADRITGKLSEPEKGEDGFRCYAASQESTYPNVRTSRHNNFDLLKTKKSSDEMAKLIIETINNQLPRSAKIFRIHSSGDFFNQEYFDAWIMVAKHFSDIVFYAYTKSLAFWINRLNNIPDNFKLNASKGGKQDLIIDKYNLKYSVVVFSEEEAANYPLTDFWKEKLKREKGLSIDHDDEHAYGTDYPFALLIHGIQPKGSKASEGLKKLGGIGGKSSYSKKKL